MTITSSLLMAFPLSDFGDFLLCLEVGNCRFRQTEKPVEMLHRSCTSSACLSNRLDSCGAIAVDKESPSG